MNETLQALNRANKRGMISKALNKMYVLVLVIIVMWAIYMITNVMRPNIAEKTDKCSLQETKIEQLYCRKVALVKDRKKEVWERDAYIEQVQSNIGIMNKSIAGLNSQIHALDQQIYKEQWEWVEYQEEQVPYLDIPWFEELGEDQAPKWAAKLTWAIADWTVEDIWLQTR